LFHPPLAQTISGGVGAKHGERNNFGTAYLTDASQYIPKLCQDLKSPDK
jgi:hypothetical protein